MLSVQHDITIGTTQFKSGDNSRLIDLCCEASLAVPVNACRMVFTIPSDLSFTEGDAVAVKLGYGSDLSLVFTGIVASIEWSVGSVAIEARSSFQELAALRVNSYFENVFAAEIVRGLAGETSVSIGTTQPGLRFAIYAVGNNRSAWYYIHDLAAQCGFDFYANEKDKLTFILPLPTSLPTLLQFGVNLLNCQIEQNQPTITGIEVFGESPASFGQGPQAATWFTKTMVKGSGGDSDKVARQYIPTARTQEVATQMATALWQKAKPKKKGTLMVLGKADLLIGGLVIVQSMPSDAQNGQYRIVGLRHTIQKRTGFLTQLSVEEVI